MRSTKSHYQGVSAGNYPWLQIDHHINPVEFSIFVHEIGAGNVSSFKVQATLDDVGVPNSGAGTTNVELSATGFDLVSAINASAGYSKFWADTPVAAIRFVPVTVSGSVNTTFTLLQSGN